jgi:murein DD-endopeptidase MepM/ murein hydrolase activator NlpD
LRNTKNWRVNRQTVWPLFGIIFTLLLLPACQSHAVVAVAGGNELPGVPLTAVPPTTTLTAVSPTATFITASLPDVAASPMPSFSLADPTQLTQAAPTLTAAPTVSTLTPTPVQPAITTTPIAGSPTASSVVSMTSTAVTPTVTLLPTFTPPAPPDTSANEHYWLNRPVAEGGVVWTNKYYPYGSSRGGELRPHHGVEFDVPRNTEILAAASGTVVVAGPDDKIAYGAHTNFYGNLVVIQHDTLYNGQPVYTLYGHLTQPLVTVGQHVEVEEVIALSGVTGVADGPHMHFEVRVGENSYEATRNPLLWLKPFPDRGTVAGRVVFPNGALAYEAPVRLERVDAPSRYTATTTYAQETLNADDDWQENFVLDDVYAGYYEAIVSVGNTKFKQEVWVYPRMTSFVEIVISP